MRATPIFTQPLTPESFYPFGDVIDVNGTPDLFINGGRCARYHNRARLDFIDSTAGISIFDSETVALPYSLTMMERHPLGSQTFLPVGAARCLVIVAEDEGGRPVSPQAFLSVPGQGFNILRNIWHGILAPLDEGRFFVIDRIGDGPNLETHDFSIAVVIDAPKEDTP